MERFNDRLAKKIRKILLINVDNEIKKKKRNKNFILINSMTPIQLETKFLQIKEEPINTPTSYFTNLSTKFLVERVVDKNRKINYFYTDNLGKKEGMLILNKNPKNFFIKYSASNLKMNLGMLLNEEEKIDKIQTQSTKDSINDYVQFYTLNLNKKNIGEIKSSAYLNNIQDIKKDSEEIDYQNSSSNQKKEYFWEKNKKANYKFLLINFCYTRLKKKLSKKVSSVPISKMPTIKEENNQEKITIGIKETNKEEIGNDKIEKKKLKKKKNLFSLFSKIQNDKDGKDSKITKEPKENEDINNLMKYKSSENNGFVKKLKELYGKNNKNNNDNNIYRKSKRTESQVKLNNKLFKLNTENNIGGANEGLRISIKSNKKQKTLRTKTSKKIMCKFFSPEKLAKLRVSNKFKLKKSHKYLLDIGEENYNKNNIKVFIY